MAYISESSVSAARARRRRRAAITLSIVGLMLLATFLYAAAYWQGWVGDDSASGATPTATCTPTPTPTLLAPSKVTVNVYNATSRTGLAKSVAQQLKKQGFKIGAVANDPLTRVVDGTAEIRYGERGESAALTVQLRQPTAKMLVDNRNGSSVDLVLGEKYQKLTTPPKSGAKPATTAKATPSGTATPPC